MSEELTLLPCPACKNTNVVLRVDTRAYGFCPACGMCGPCAPKVDAEYAIRQWNELPRSLAWTDEPPKQDGWYFMQVRLPGKPVRVVHVHRVPMMPKRASSGMLCVSQIQQDEPPGTPLCEIDPTHRFWAGPIPQPRKPNN